MSKELTAYLLAYNPVRLAMLRTAGERGVSAGGVSFVDAVRWLCARMLGLDGVADLIVNPPRPGRWEPRVIRGRLKAYDWLVRPRAELKAKMASGDGS